MKIDFPTLFQKTPMVFITIVLILGILFSNIAQSINLPIIFAGILLIPFILIRKWKFSSLLLLLMLFMLGWGYSSYKSSVFIDSSNKVQILSEQQLKFTGVIVEQGKYSNGQKFTLENVTLESEIATVREQLKYFVYNGNKNIQNAAIGDTLRGNGKYFLFNEVRNPGGFDSKKTYHRKQIAGRIYSDDEIIVNTNSDWNFWKSVESFRSKVKNALTKYSDRETSALLSAMLLGDRSEIDWELRESFADIGVIHILAVSGLHVGYVLLVLILITKLLRIRWGWDKLLIILGLLIFVLISGGRPSVVRASIMAGLYISAPLLNRRAQPWNIIATAAFIILIFKPLAIYDLGFQLSFSAVISIIFFLGQFRNHLPDALKLANIQNIGAKFIWGLLLVTVSAQIGTIPISAYHFGRIPLIAVVANIFVIPLVGVFIAVGLTKLLLFWLPPINFLFAQSAWLLKEGIHGVVETFSLSPLTSLNVPQFSWINLIQYISIILLIFIVLRRKLIPILIAFALVVNTFLWPWALKSDATDFIFLDAKRYESTLINFSDGRSMLINAGIHNQWSNDPERKVLPAVKYLNINKLDWLIRTYGNSFQNVGMIKTLEKIAVDAVVDVRSPVKEWSYSHFLSQIAYKQIPYTKIQRGDIIQVSDDSYVQFLLPDNKYSNIEKPPFVARIVSNEATVLLTSKLSSSDIKVLNRNKPALKADVLKMPYPKTLPQGFNEFVANVGAKYVVISGFKTSKQSPDFYDLTNIMSANGAEVLRIDLLGAIWFTSDGNFPLERKKWH